MSTDSSPLPSRSAGSFGVGGGRGMLGGGGGRGMVEVGGAGGGGGGTKDSAAAWPCPVEKICTKYSASNQVHSTDVIVLQLL